MNTTKTMALKPRMSEKAYASSKMNNTYVFQVPSDANKLTVAAAVAVQFGVVVEDVRMAVAKGKTKKSYKKGGKPTVGKRTDIKKAFVRIKTGDKINIFGDVEEAEKAAEAKAEKDAKKTSKATKTKKPAVKAKKAEK